MNLSQDLLTELIKAIPSALGSIIVIGTAIVVYWKKINLKGIKKKLDDFFDDNKNDHKRIFILLNKIENERHIADEIRKTIKDAITYSGNCYVNQMLDVFGESIISFAKDILEISFANTTYNQISIKWTNMRREMLDGIHTISNSGNVTISYLDGFIDYVNKWKESYLKEVEDIYNDNVNNKDSRFETETLRYVQKIANEAVKYMQKNKIEDTIINECKK